MPSKEQAGRSRRGAKRSHGAAYAFYVRLVSGCAWGATLLLWLSAASVHIHPDPWGVLAWMGLMFPLFLAGVLVALVFTLLFCRSRVWIPLLGLAGCCLTVRQYVPINIPSPAPKQSLKVMSYNVMAFALNDTTPSGRNKILQYIGHSGASIVCLQEAYLYGKTWRESHNSPFVQALPYCDTVTMATPWGYNGLAIFSRFPIVGKRKLCQSGTNGAALFKVLLGRGDTLCVINCHLQSNHLSPGERQAYHSMVRKPTAEVDVATEDERMSIVSKVGRSARLRAGQADTVARYVERYPHRSFLVCGDFNDTPISYARHRIASCLDDAYVATGNGPGRSFNRDAIYVRIDHMFVSPDWRVFSCHIDREAGTVSDHYPIVCHIKRRTKSER